MPRVSIEMFSASGKSAGRVSKQTAARLVEEGKATWIDQGFGRWSLREAVETARQNACSLTARDMEIGAGIAGSLAEERAVRRRIGAWAPRRAEA